jgi:virginiamycin B lyase
MLRTPLRAALLSLLLAALPARSVVIKEYLLRPGSVPTGMALGADGNIWYCEQSSNSIVRINPDGSADEFEIPTAGFLPEQIVSAGPYLFFIGSAHPKVGRISLAGSIVEIGSGNFVTMGIPSGLAVGGNHLWITHNLDTLVYLSLSSYGQPIYDNCTEAATDWTTAQALGFAYGDVLIRVGSEIRRLNPDQCTITNSFAALTGSLRGFSVGADRNVWWTQGNSVTRSSGSCGGCGSSYTVPTAGATPAGIVFAPDGTAWFTERTGNKIGRVTADGVFTEYPLPNANSQPHGIAYGPDGSVWFTEKAGRIGRLKLTPNGDVNNDGVVDVLDVFHVINFLFAGGPAPNPF